MMVVCGFMMEFIGVLSMGILKLKVLIVYVVDMFFGLCVCWDGIIVMLLNVYV